MLEQKKTNHKIIERLLIDKIDAICCILKLRFENWDIDKRLFLTILKEAQKSASVKKITKLADEYDALIDSAKHLKIQLNEKYYWLYKLNLNKT